MRKNRPIYNSKCGNDLMRGNSFQIAEKYAEKAKEALGEKDTVQAEIYRQHEHHYRSLHEAGQ